MQRAQSPCALEAPARSLPANTFLELPFPADMRESQQGLARLVSAPDLSIVFQPIVEAESLRLFAYEALLRCGAPGYDDPSALFAKALQYRCCGRLGRMIREIAVPLCAGHPLFLNVHPAELEQRWLVQPDDPLYYHDNPVFLEVTESVPLDHFDLCRNVMREIRSRGGVHFVIDDLGAGYSNLKRIADLEPAMVKIDRDLVLGMEASARQQRLVAAIVRLCTDLGARTVAEGVETAAEVAVLRSAGVQYLQGFYFGRPAFPPPEIER